MLKDDTKQQNFKIFHLHFVKSEFFFHPLLVVNRVSETQLQVGENPNLIISRLRCQIPANTICSPNVGPVS